MKAPKSTSMSGNPGPPTTTGSRVAPRTAFRVKRPQMSCESIPPRPDTLFGVTYMVLAPEHPAVSVLTTPEQRSAVEAYRQQAATKSDLDRTDLAKGKSGVFTGGYATNR